MKDWTKSLFAGGLLVAVAFLLFQGTQPQTVAPTPEEKEETQAGCPVEDVTVDIVPQDALSGGALDLCAIIERKQGDEWVRLSDVATTGASDIAASPFQTYRIWTLDDGSGDFSCDASPSPTGDFYADYTEFTTGCESVWTVATSNYRMGGLTLTGYYKFSDVTDASSSTNMTVTAGATETVNIEAKSVSKRQFGQSADDTSFTGLDYSSVWCLDRNKSQTDSVELRKHGTSDEFARVAEPDQHPDASGRNAICWAVSKNFRDGTTENLDLWFDFDDSAVPTSGENYTMSVYDVALYEDANDKNAVKFGVEDEDGNDVGNATSATMVIYFGTGT